MLVSFNKPVFIILILLAPVIWMMMNRSNLKSSRFKHKIILGGLRALLLFILVLALSDPRIMAPSDKVNLFFCLDLSESVGDEEKTAAEVFMKKVSAGMQAEDQAGLIIFGKHPSLEVPLRKNFKSDTTVVSSKKLSQYHNVSFFLFWPRYVQDFGLEYVCRNDVSTKNEVQIATQVHH